MSSALRRFGILDCLACGEPHEFVSYSASCKHITDAFCCECGYSYGRRSEVDIGTPPAADDPRAAPMVRRERHDIPVVTDAEARLALARLQARHPGKADIAWVTALRPPPEPAQPASPPVDAHEPDETPARKPEADPIAELLDVEDDGSRRASFLRSLRSWQNPKSP